MPTRKLQSEHGNGRDKPNVVDEPGGDGAPQVLRSSDGDGGGGGGGAIAPEVAVVENLQKT